MPIDKDPTIKATEPEKGREPALEAVFALTKSPRVRRVVSLMEANDPAYDVALGELSENERVAVITLMSASLNADELLIVAEAAKTRATDLRGS